MSCLLFVLAGTNLLRPGKNIFQEQHAVQKHKFRLLQDPQQFLLLKIAEKSYYAEC